jgi:hypothetical protein
MACYNPNCMVCVTVDTDDTVVESNEENNSGCRTFGG